MMGKAWALSVAFVVTVAGSSCSGDDKQTALPSPAGTRISKAEYIAKADRICAATNEKINALPDDFGALKFNLFDVATFHEAVIPIARDREARIRALGAPPGDEDAIDAIAAKASEAIDLGHEVVKLAREGDEGGTRVALRAFRLANLARNALRRDLGLEECGGAPSPEKEAYIARGDEICADIFPKLNAVRPPDPEALGSPTVAEYAAALAPLLRDLAGQLRTLKVPAGDEESVGAILLPLEDGVALVQRAAASGNEQTAAELLGRSLDAFRAAVVAARNYSFMDCGAYLRKPIVFNRVLGFR